MNSTQISKYISYLLRHDKTFRNGMDAEGWVAITDLQARLSAKGWQLTVDDIQALNVGTDKIRWAIDLDLERIRATHGHSLTVQPVSIPSAIPGTLYHGTAVHSLPSIIEKGLLTGSRNHVHLTPAFDVALKTGARHGRPFVIEINTQSLSQHGILPVATSEDVWLCEPVPPHALEFGRWYLINGTDQRKALFEELKRELSPSHALYPELDKLYLSWRSRANDDCLFTNADTGCVHEVHLTWIQKVETNPLYPGSASFANLEEWINESLVPEWESMAGDFA